LYSISRIFQGRRLEGNNYGLPTTFIELGESIEYPKVDGLVEEIYLSSQNKRICIKGTDTTKVGTGSLIKSLYALGLLVELEVQGSILTPGWYRSVNNWVVDYVPRGGFTYNILRRDDMIRFDVSKEQDLDLFLASFDELKSTPATRFIRFLPSSTLSESDNKKLYLLCLTYLRKKDGSKLFVGGNTG